MRVLLGLPAAGRPQHGATPEPQAVGWGRPNAHQPHWPGQARPARGTCQGPSHGPQDLDSGSRARWGTRWDWVEGLHALRPRLGPHLLDPHTTDNPNGAETLDLATPGGRRQFLTCTVLLYRDFSLYHTPLNGVHFLIIYIKINIYKYI